jgi:hypothetical protein
MYVTAMRKKNMTCEFVFCVRSEVLTAVVIENYIF